MEPAAPSTSRPFKEEFVSPRIKRKRLHFTESEKVMISNVFKYVGETWPAEKYRSKEEMKDKTADILGISKSSVYRILKEYTETDSTHTVKPAESPKKWLSLESEPEGDMPPWAAEMQNKWITAEERRAQVLENMAASMETLATAVDSLAAETANTQRSVTQIEWILLNKLQTDRL